MIEPENKKVVGHFIRGFLRPTETFIGNQITSMRQYQPVVFCHHLIHGHSFQSIEATSVVDTLSPAERVLEKSYYKFFRGLTQPAAIRLAEAVQQSHAQILHFHYLVDARFFLPVFRRLKLPSVVSGYGWDVSSFPRAKFGFGRHYVQPIFREMDLFLAMSDDMKKDMIALGCPEGKIRVHYYGTDVQRFAYPARKYNEKSTLTILFCGRLIPKKSPQSILLALRYLEEQRQSLPDWRLIFVGEGPLRGELEHTVQEYGWKSKVQFKGHISHDSQALLDEYRSADIYILPSMTAKGEKEGIPGTLVEAMASGLPCISTYHAGIPSVMHDDQQGKLLSEGDVEALAQTLRGLMQSHESRSRLGKSAALYAFNNLDLKSKTKELEEIYDSFLIGH